MPEYNRLAVTTCKKKKEQDPQPEADSSTIAISSSVRPYNSYTKRSISRSVATI